MSNADAYVLIVRQSGLMLCRQTTHDEHALHTQYPDYMTSLGVWDGAEMMTFLAEEYPERWHAWQIAIQPLIAQTVDVVILD